MLTGREGATHPGTSPTPTAQPTPACVVRGATMLTVFCTAVGSGLDFLHSSLFDLLFVFSPPGDVIESVSVCLRSTGAPGLQAQS